MDFTNGGNTVSITVNFVIKFRPALPIYLNGYGVNDDALSAHGFTISPQIPAVGFTTYLNNFACNPACAPYTSYTPPQSAGDTFTDETGHTITAITPHVIGGVAGYVHQESGHPPGNSDDTMVMVYSLLGGTSTVFAGPNGTLSDTPLYTISGSDFNQSDTGYWSTSDPTIFYVLKNTNVGDSSTVLKRLKFNGTGSYTATNFAFTFPADPYGRANADQGGHQDVTAADWMPVFTKKDYSIVGTVVSTTFTRVSGSTIDAELVGQNIYLSGVDTGKTVVSIGAGTFVASGTFTCVVCTITFLVPHADLAIHLPEAFTDSGYLPVVGLLTGNTPVVYKQNDLGNGGGLTCGFHVDPTTGKYYCFGGSAAGVIQDWVTSFTPGVDFTMTFVNGPVATPNPFSLTCNSIAANRTPSNALNACTSPAHSGPTELSDGTPWWMTNTDALDGGHGTMMYRFRDAPTAPVTYSNSGYTGNLIWGGYVNEFGSSRGSSSQHAPFYILSTDNPHGTAWRITNCTAANPSVCTSDTSNPTTNGTAIVINNASGCAALNGAHTAVTVSGTSITTNVNCTGNAQTGTASVTTAAAISFAGGDNDWIQACRGLGSFSVCYRYGHTRSVVFNDDDLGGFYSIPRAGLSMDGSIIYYGTDFGTPENSQIVFARTPFCNGLANNAFDCTGTHVVSTSVGATTGMLNFTAPNTGDVVIEIGKEQRLTDSHQNADPSGNCPTPGWAVFSAASSSAFTCLSWGIFTGHGTWTAGDPDTTYQVFYDTTGSSSHSHQFTGLTTGATYYYRVIVYDASGSYGATGSFVPVGATPITSGINTTGSVMFRGGILPTR